ncbi:phospholipase A1-IIgamma-like [Mangifera indica]|uniref:phospholipase A1-IIgamma-like n=1 Tax=Mangifera indica TaxID=29780 RepID=UPI001CFAC060|nr:phospholipase A1-IIgamma-like [Mangifera indica]
MNNYVYGDSKIDFFAKGSRAWIRYVAVATDEGKRQLGRRDIMICFRGSVTIGEWVKDFQFGQSSAAPILGQHTGNARVHEGFFSIYMSARNQVLNAVKKLVNQYEHEEISITVTGHCLGGSFAILKAADIVANGYNNKSDCSCMPKAMVTVFAFASPQVGNSDFVKVFDKFNNLHLLHTRHYLDIVPELPPTTNYSKMGTLLRITYTNFTIWDFPGPIIFTVKEILTRFHHLKNLLVAIEKQQEKKGLLFAAAPTVAVFGAPQFVGQQGANFVAAPQGAPQFADLPGAKFANDDTVILDDEIDESNVVMEKLANGNYKLYLRIPQLQTT